MKKILVLGGTGAMGTYLVPLLAEQGYKVDVVSLDSVVSDNKNIAYITAQADDKRLMQKLLDNKYDAIVDFLYHDTIRFSERFEMFLENTEHYLFLSSYRVYGDDKIITENSPRLLDVSEDKEFLLTDDYSLYKARSENMLSASKYTNWTILRPAITFSKTKYQLINLEAYHFVRRARQGKEILMPSEVLSCVGTMSWAGDIAKMISRLVLNPEALCETYTLSTAEHHTWGEIADFYKDIIGLSYIPVDMETYLKCIEKDMYRQDHYYKLVYDRLYDRVVDNTKILTATGMRQSELMPLYDGLKAELTALPKEYMWEDNVICRSMDEVIKSLQRGNC